ANLLVMLAVGGWLSLTGEMSKANFLLALMMGFALVSPLMRILFMTGNLKQIESGLDRIDDILTLPEQRYDNPAQKRTNHDIAFQSVRFGYEQKPIFKDLSFEVPSGTSTAIVGRSGSGKSTIVNLLARFWDVEAGAISIGTVNIQDFAQQELHQLVSFVFQDNFLFDDTIWANIRCAQPDASDEQIMEACKKAQAHHFIMALPKGYDTSLGEKGTRLSGGERQRLSIARLILRDAPIIVLDEATAFADQLNARALTKALKAATKGKSVITIAHRLETILEADQIIFLQEDKPALLGQHRQLLQECKAYGDLWQAYRDMDGWSSSSEAEQQDNKAKELAS
ncbi:MAG: ABC transporter ATP-binding protein/permease, partial [Cohaesibacter sp.]|nr:ABC transporter ATP-binding protein/permease [Cohaesibacter sp.]